MIFKQNLEVPEGIRFLGDWEDFRFDRFPPKCIINKESPGCGFTEYCINGPENVILCSPRKLLLKNKYDQHSDRVYLVVNEMDKDPGVDKDLNKASKTPIIKIGEKVLTLEEEEEIRLAKNKEMIAKLYGDLKQYKFYCELHKIPMKILVTYDSYHLVLETLTKMGIYGTSHKFYTIVDEFQSILHDARFKSDVEMGFIERLKESMTALFVSATPMIDEDISDLDMFNGLPYYQLDWRAKDPSRIIKPNLIVSQMTSIGAKSEEIINTYLSGNFESVIVMREGQLQEIRSDQAVFYVNSVNQIISIIKRNKLSPDQVNILCADTEENSKKIHNRLGKKFNIGEIPLKGDIPKMFTFCTRTVYLGADFYSLCARSFIFSDSNSDCLAVDISEDLPQILGRQRLNENPWKNTANFYYKTTADYRKMVKEDFDAIISKKDKETESLLRSFDNALDLDKESLANKYKKDAKNSNYHDDYVAVNRIIDYSTGVRRILLVPVQNDLVRVNEKRAFRIQQIDYKDRFTVFSKVREKLNHDDYVNIKVAEFFKQYESCKTIVDKLKLLCENTLDKEIVDVILAQLPDSDSIKSYYIALGPDRLKHLGYNVTYIKKELGIVTFSQELLINSIYSEFHIGEIYSLSNLKQKLTNIYDSINYSKVPKALDIQGYFEIKEIAVYEKKDDGKRRKIRCYKLIKSYEDQIRLDLKYSN